MQLKNKKINFLGDSITEGIVGVAEQDMNFVTIIAQQTGSICRNYGIGGTRIARQTTPSEFPIWDKDFMSRVKEMDADADIIVVFGGTNDFGHGDAPIGTMESRDAYTFYGALHILYRSLIEEYPRSKIIVLTPTHRRNEAEPLADGNRPQSDGLLIDYVKAIRKVAEYYALPVLDLYKNSGLQPNIPTIQALYMPDRLHPNGEGHKLLANHIIKFLESL